MKVGNKVSPGTAVMFDVGFLCLFLHSSSLSLSRAMGEAVFGDQARSSLNRCLAPVSQTPSHKVWSPFTTSQTLLQATHSHSTSRVNSSDGHAVICSLLGSTWKSPRTVLEKTHPILPRLEKPAAVIASFTFRHSHPELGHPWPFPGVLIPISHLLQAPGAGAPRL